MTRAATDLAEHAELQEHARRLSRVSLRELFATDPGRAERHALEVEGLLLDHSKHRLDDEAWAVLHRVARAVDLEGHIGAMFAGERINATEGRAVLHVALRAPEGSHFVVDGEDVMPEVLAMRERAYRLAEQVRSGDWRGHGGKRIRNVLNIGIGGSDLGPAMARQALEPWCDPELQLGFVSNVDGSDLTRKVARLDPAETLFIVSSKTFTTQETLANARAARAWIQRGLGADADLSRHFIGVTTNVPEAVAFGVSEENIVGFWDWVGGRYSLTSAIGLSVLIGLGREHWEALLGGFHAMDEHFRTAPLEENMPVRLGLLAHWYGVVLGAQSHAVLPYSEALSLFTPYLQQLDMESNGKGVRLDGTPVVGDSGAVVWGRPGTNGQHAFYQLLHQGTRLVPCDFIAFARNREASVEQQDMLVANCFAQAEALAFGRTVDEVLAEGVDEALARHRSFGGNRPSSLLFADELTPRTLGLLVALYEHKVFTQAVLFGVNAFDQWGVELGKKLAGAILPELQSDQTPSLRHDSSTNAMIERYRALRGGSQL